jgi:hypothetical protein
LPGQDQHRVAQAAAGPGHREVREGALAGGGVAAERGAQHGGESGERGQGGQGGQRGGAGQQQEDEHGGGQDNGRGGRGPVRQERAETLRQARQPQRREETAETGERSGRDPQPGGGERDAATLRGHVPRRGEKRPVQGERGPQQRELDAAAHAWRRRHRRPPVGVPGEGGQQPDQRQRQQPAQRSAPPHRVPQVERQPQRGVGAQGQGDRDSRPPGVAAARGQHEGGEREGDRRRDDGQGAAGRELHQQPRQGQRAHGDGQCAAYAEPPHQRPGEPGGGEAEHGQHHAARRAAAGRRGCDPEQFQRGEGGQRREEGWRARCEAHGR